MASIAQMVVTIRRYGVVDRRVLWAVEQVDRKVFVPRWWREAAYEDRPLPIGFGQTISQPYTVARMVELLMPPGKKVLEIGTGSGYEAAILSRLFDQVYSVEVVPELVRMAEFTIRNLKFENVRIKTGDGKKGWRKYAPYDATIVAADAQEIPPALISQLAEGGRIVIPVKEELKRGTKIAGVMKWESFDRYLFVPLV